MPKISVHVDESGDLAFNQDSPKFFTVGYVIIIDKPAPIEGLKIKKLLHSINLMPRKNENLSEFKFSSDTTYARKRLFSTMLGMDVDFGITCLKKDSVKPSPSADFNSLYRTIVIDNMVEVLVNEHADINDPNNSIDFIIDRSLNKHERTLFNKHYYSKIFTASAKKNPKLHVAPNITHADSQQDPLLQVADYIAGATQRKMQANDSRYYDMISPKIRYRKMYD